MPGRGGLRAAFWALRNGDPGGGGGIGSVYYCIILIGADLLLHDDGYLQVGLFYSTGRSKSSVDIIIFLYDSPMQSHLLSNHRQIDKPRNSPTSTSATTIWSSLVEHPLGRGTARLLGTNDQRLKVCYSKAVVAMLGLVLATTDDVFRLPSALSKSFNIV